GTGTREYRVETDVGCPQVAQLFLFSHRSNKPKVAGSFPPTGVEFLGFTDGTANKKSDMGKRGCQASGDKLHGLYIWRERTPDEDCCRTIESERATCHKLLLLIGWTDLIRENAIRDIPNALGRHTIELVKEGTIVGRTCQHHVGAATQLALRSENMPNQLR